MRLAAGDARSALTALEASADGVADTGGSVIDVPAVEWAVTESTVRYDRRAWHLPVWSGPNRVGGGPQKATTLRMTLRSGWRSRRRGCAGSCATTAGPGLPRSW
ncbi:hypothetical protein [Nonomuraea africana]|uniref:hypothetical protein n=1 Tax=Nonomuraea africana TaxID=46171 RepID=UPI0031CE5C0F